MTQIAVKLSLLLLLTVTVALSTALVVGARLPDEGTVLLQTRDNLTNLRNLHLLDVRTTRTANLTHHLSNPVDPHWSADGRRLVFSAENPQSNLFVFDTETYRVRQLTDDPALDTEPQWSPDGLRIAFRSFPVRESGSLIVVINADGTRRTVVSPRYRFNWRISWSADGSQLAYESATDDLSRVYVADVTNGAFRALPLEQEDALTPQWSPTGAQLLFSSWQNGALEVFTYDLSTDETVNLSDHPSADRGAVWSPDGERVLFVSDRGQNGIQQYLYVTDVESGDTRRLIDAATNDLFPEWSPDGTQLVFVSLREGNPDVFLADLTTGELRNLTASPEVEVAPLWRPAQ